MSYVDDVRDANKEREARNAERQHELSDRIHKTAIPGTLMGVTSTNGVSLIRDNVPVSAIKKVQTRLAVIADLEAKERSSL